MNCFGDVIGGGVDQFVNDDVVEELWVGGGRKLSGVGFIVFFFKGEGLVGGLVYWNGQWGFIQYLVGNCNGGCFGFVVESDFLIGF